MNRLGEEGQSDRAAERYKAEQSEDKILTKKNTSAKYRRQVKDDRSAYARKNPKYAALRPELRKHMSLKTRRANKMGRGNGDIKKAVKGLDKAIVSNIPKPKRKQVFNLRKAHNKDKLELVEKFGHRGSDLDMLEVKDLKRKRKYLDRKTKVANRMGAIAAVRGHGERPALRKHNKSVFRKMPNDSKKKMFARVKNEDKSRLANYEKRMQLPEAPHMTDNFMRIRENRKQLDRKTNQIEWGLKTWEISYHRSVNLGGK